MDKTVGFLLMALVCFFFAGVVSGQTSTLTPAPTSTPGYFESNYNPVPKAGGPSHLRMLGVWGYFTEVDGSLNNYRPAAGDEVGAFWNNSTEDILVGTAMVTAAMAADSAYSTVDIYGRDPDDPSGVSYGLINGSEIFYRVYLLARSAEYDADPGMIFQSAFDPWYKHDLAVQLPITPTPVVTPSLTPTITPVPTSTPPPTATPTPTPTSSPTPTIVAAATPSPSLSPTPSPSATPIGSPLPSPTFRSPFPILDYDGDGISDIAVFRPTSGLWAIKGVTRAYFGAASDLPVPGDYNGDGTAEIALFRPASGLWAVRGVTRVYFGSPGDLPLPRDYAGEGTVGIALFRPTSGLWAIRDRTRIYFGGSGDQPVPGYYFPGAPAEVAIFRSGSGLWAVKGETRLYFGGVGDKPIPGDYQEEGMRFWCPAIFRPATGLWSVRHATRVYFGGPADRPLPAEYYGKGYDEIGIYRQSTGLWAVRGETRVYFGGGGDIPVVR